MHYLVYIRYLWIQLTSGLIVVTTLLNFSLIGFFYFKDHQKLHSLYSWVSYEVTEVTGVISKTKHSYQSDSIIRFMY